MSSTISRIEGPGDAELISAVRGGDLDAYGDLFERHVEAARRLARQLVSPGDVDDLVSDAFAKVLTVLQRGDGPDVAFRAYLLTAIRRLRVDRLRAGSKLHVTDDLEPFDAGVPFRDTAVEGFENAAAARAFASLPERWQLVLWHTEVEGQKPAEVAALLGMTPNSVSALAYRAREGLRQAFLNEHVSELDEDTCRWTHEHLGAYIRQGVSRRDAAKVEGHLQDCRKCMAIYLELTEVNSNLAGILAPLLLGGAAAAYVSSGQIAAAAAAGGAGVTSIFGRARDFVAGNGAATAAASVAAIAVVAGGGYLATQNSDVLSGADAPIAPAATAPATPGQSGDDAAGTDSGSTGDGSNGTTGSGSDGSGGDSTINGGGDGNAAVPGTSSTETPSSSSSSSSTSYPSYPSYPTYPSSAGTTTPGSSTNAPATNPGSPSVPSQNPTKKPTKKPTKNPSTSKPSPGSGSPSSNPSNGSTTRPTPTNPTTNPTTVPTGAPSTAPTAAPSNAASSGPSTAPTAAPTAGPIPTAGPDPTSGPTAAPTTAPSNNPTAAPTAGPSNGPTTDGPAEPTTAPSPNPTGGPTTGPTGGPTTDPTVTPTSDPTVDPTPDLGLTLVEKPPVVGKNYRVVLKVSGLASGAKGTVTISGTGVQNLNGSAGTSCKSSSSGWSCDTAPGGLLTVSGNLAQNATTASLTFTVSAPNKPTVTVPLS